MDAIYLGLGQTLYYDLIDLDLRSMGLVQDKLHQNLARKRTLASVGTHDLDTIKETQSLFSPNYPLSERKMISRIVSVLDLFYLSSDLK